MGWSQCPLPPPGSSLPGIGLLDLGPCCQELSLKWAPISFLGFRYMVVFFCHCHCHYDMKMCANSPFYSVAGHCSAAGGRDERLNAFSHQNLLQPKIILQLHKLLHRLRGLNRSHQVSTIYDHICSQLVRNTHMFTAVVFVHVDPMNYVTLPHRGFTCWSNLGLDSFINAKKFVDNTQNHLDQRFLKTRKLFTIHNKFIHRGL